MKLFYISIIVVLCFPFGTMAQEKFDGTQKDLTTNAIGSISYASMSFSKQGIFYNRFSIFQKSNSTKSDTIYVVDINFNKVNNDISIYRVDKTTNQSTSKTIKFRSLPDSARKSASKPIYCVKNYKFNDTLLSVTSDNKADILFTIADTINPVFFLHQVASVDGKKRYDLDKFRKTYLTAHLSHAKDYWKWYKADSLRRVKEIKNRNRDSMLIRIRKARLLALQSEIDTEKILINTDKDRIMGLLNKKRMSMNLSDTTANEGLHQVFVRKMDDVFTEYFNKPININAGITGSYKIHVNTDGSKRIVEKFTSEKVPECFNAQFTAIRDIIEHLPLANEEISICDNNSINTIKRNHSVRFDRFRSEAADLKVSLDSVFKPILNPVDLELKKICAEKIKMATIYNYSYQVVSRVERQKWIVKGDRITDTHDTVISNQDNILLFYDKNIKRKRGRYDVSLNTTKFNDRIFGPVLDFVQLDYKFMTYIGFNIGAFIGNEDILSNGVTKDNFSQRLWNIFIIHHHFGVFGGTSYNQNGSTANVFENYGEGGIYVAPGKCFYFKLGIAQYKDTGLNAGSITKPILGCSLIFPVFHFEGGYNFALEHPYVMAGINIPFNR